MRETITFPTLNDVMPDVETFNNYCKAFGITTLDPDIYTNLIIRYGESTLRYASYTVAAAKVLRDVVFHYDIFLNQKDALDALYKLDLADFARGGQSIQNVAQNPNTEPSTGTDELLAYINAQQSTQIRHSEFDAIQRKYQASLRGYINKLLEALEHHFRGIYTEGEEVYFYGRD